MAFGTDESVLFREVCLIQGVLIERFHWTTENDCVQSYLTTFISPTRGVYYDSLQKHNIIIVHCLQHLFPLLEVSLQKHIIL